MSLNALKELPGYKALLKAVIREQIQLLVEQLSNQTGEETIVLSANLSDGTLSHIGSESGKIFLEKEQEVKLKFLGFCLKRSHDNKENSASLSFFENNTKCRPGIGSTSFGGKHKRAHSPDPGDITVNPKSPRYGNSTSGVNTTYPNSASSMGYYSGENSPCVGQFPPTQMSGKPLLTGSPGFSASAGTSTSNSVYAVGQDTHAADKDGQNRVDMSVVKVEVPDGDTQLMQHNNTGRNMGGAMENFGQDTTDFKNRLDQVAGMVPDIWNNQGGPDDQVPPGVVSDATLKQWTASMSRSGLSATEINQVQTMYMQRQLRSFKCSFCDKRFREKTNLKVHVRIHTGERPFQCEICGKSFAHSSNLKQHERAVHGILPPVPLYKQQFYNDLNVSQTAFPADPYMTQAPFPVMSQPSQLEQTAAVFTTSSAPVTQARDSMEAPSGVTGGHSVDMQSLGPAIMDETKALLEDSKDDIGLMQKDSDTSVLHNVLE